MRSTRRSGVSEDAGYGLRVAEPRGGFGLQSLAAISRQLVEARPAVRLGDAPLRLNQAAVLQAMQRLIERTVIDPERARRTLLEPERDGIPMQRTPTQCLEDEQIERAFEERQFGHGDPLYLSAYPVCAKV